MWFSTRLFAVGLFFVGLSRADQLLSWEPEGFRADIGGWPNPWVPAGVAKNVDSRSGVTLGPGLRLGSLNDAWGSAADFNSKTQAGAEQAGQYFLFELAPAPRHVLALSALEMNVRLTAATLEGGVWYLWEYRVGDASFMPIGKPMRLSSSAGVRDEAPGHGVRLPALDLTGIAALRRVESVVTFRLISWSENVPRYHFSIGRLAGPDLVLHGVVKPAR